MCHYNVHALRMSLPPVQRSTMAKCVRVVKVAGKVEVLGCGAFGHTYRSCPLVDTDGWTVNATRPSV